MIFNFIALRLRGFVEVGVEVFEILMDLLALEVLFGFNIEVFGHLGYVDVEFLFE